MTLTPAAYAQVAACNGNQDLAGQYAFAANRLGWVQVAGVPPGTTEMGLVWSAMAPTPAGTVTLFGTTPIGRLALGAVGAGPVSAVGRLLADGAGILYAVPGFAPAGTYTVQQDCTVILILSDASSQVPAIAQADVTFQGVLQRRGDRAALTQTSPGGGTQLQLTRPYSVSGCSSASLSGGFGISAFGAQPGVINPEFESPTVTPFALVGRIFSDGEGNLIADAGAANSPASLFRYTGTYTVDAECVGTMALARATTGGTTDNTPPALRFVLTQSEGNRPELLFVFDDAMRFSGLGTGR